MAFTTSVPYNIVFAVMIPITERLLWWFL